MSGVPYIFANATTSIPLSELDSNFATPVTIGTTTVGLGNTVTTLAGLSNVSTTVTNTSNVSANTSLLLQTNGGTIAATFDTNQNMGLGVTPKSGGGNLEFVSGGVVLAQGTQGTFAVNAYYNSGWKYATTGAANYYQQNSGVHSWAYASSGSAGSSITWTQAMTLDNSGELLINTTSSFVGKGYLQVAYASASSNAIVVRNTDTNYGSYLASFQNSSGSPAGYIQMTGSNSVVFGTSSDYRLKNVTGALSGYKERIMALLPKQGTWIEDSTEFRGFIAHEFQIQYPTLVSGQKDAVDAEGKPVYQGMQAGGAETIADLVALVQELTTTVTTLQAQVTALQAKVGT